MDNLKSWGLFMGILDLFKNRNSNTIIGIIDSKGSSGGKFHGQELWTFSFNFAFWYMGNSSVNTRRLYVSKKVEHPLVKELMSMAKAESIVKITFQGNVSTGGVELLKIVEFGLSDLKLQPFLNELKKEITFVDGDLGVFKLNKSADTYYHDLNWCESKAELVMKTNEVNELTKMIDRYKVIFSDQKVWDLGAKKYAAQKLISLKNDFWLDDDENEMKLEEFPNHLKLESLLFYLDDSYSFWFKDGQIFGGHVIIVYGSVNEGFTRAEMAG